MRYVTLYTLLCMLNFCVFAQDEETASEESAPEPYQLPVQSMVIDERLASSLPADQIKWLDEGENKFLARSKTNEAGIAKGNILIVTAPGKSIDSAGYVRAALDFFPTVAWHVMVISAGELSFSEPTVTIPETTSPTQDGDAPAEEVKKPEPMVVDETEWFTEQQQANQQILVNRISKAAEVLPEPQKGYILIAASSSAGLIIDGIVQRQITPSALIMLDVNHPVHRFRSTLVNDLREVVIPTLDIYQPLEQAMAKQRQSLARKDNYTQRMIPAVDPDYVGVEATLLRSIQGWLKRIMGR